MARKTRRRRGRSRGGESSAIARAASSASQVAEPTHGRRAEAGDDAGALAHSILGAGPPPDRDATAPIDMSALKKGKLYYRIGEVSQITGVKPYVLRYWESEFRLMAPQKSRSKQRLYRQRDIETILHIKRLLYEERYTIAGARKRLRELGAAGLRDVEPVLPPAAAAGSTHASGLRSDASGGARASDAQWIHGQLAEIRSLLSSEI